MIAYTDHATSSGLSPSTVATAARVEALFRVAVGRPLSAAGEADVVRFFRALGRAAAEQRQKRTALMRWRAFKSLLRYYGRGAALQAADKVHAAKALGLYQRGRMSDDWTRKAIPDDDYARLQDALAAMDARAPDARAPRQWLRPMVLLFMATGCRLSELCSLRRQDVAPDASCLVVVGKNNKQREVVVVDKEARDALLAHLQATDTLHSASDYVFRSWQFARARLDASTVQKAVRAVYRGLGIAAFGRGVHSLRHTFVTRAYHAGVDLQAIADQAGHERLDTTRLYTHVGRETIAREFAKMAQPPLQLANVA